MNRKLYSNITFNEGFYELLEEYSPEEILEVVESLPNNADLETVKAVLTYFDFKIRPMYFDVLCSTLNANSYHENLSRVDKANNSTQELSKFYNFDERIVVTLIDGERFKHINDTYGHLFGDKVIKQMGEKAIHFISQFDNSLHDLKKGNPIHKIPSCDCVIRMGGDEFVLITREYPKKEDLRKFMTITDEKFEDGFAVSVSIGQSFGTLKDLKKLIAIADKEMYRDKLERKASR